MSAERAEALVREVLASLPKPPPMRRVTLLVGECNKHSANPEYALWPYPPNGSGGRLARILGCRSANEYLGRYDRTNLCERERVWSLRVARRTVAVLKTLLMASPQPVVLLGARVCEAWGVAYAPFERVEEHTLVLPHPSGLNRAWNERGAAERARAAVASLTGGRG